MLHVGKNRSKTKTRPTFLLYRARDPFREARINTSTICLAVTSVPPPQTWAKDDEEAGVAQTPPTPRAEGRLRLLWGGREEAKNASGARTDAGRLQGSYLSRTNNPRMENRKPYQVRTANLYYYFWIAPIQMFINHRNLQPLPSGGHPFRPLTSTKI